jgi:hypothetical protein
LLVPSFAKPIIELLWTKPCLPKDYAGWLQPSCAASAFGNPLWRFLSPSVTVEDRVRATFPHILVIGHPFLYKLFSALPFSWRQASSA